MARGRRPKPTKLKVLQGTFEANKSNPDEPVLESGRPSTPKWLKGVAREYYEDLCDRLETMGVLTEVDGDIIELAAKSYARWREAEEMVDADGPVSTSEKGTSKRHPATLIAKDEKGQWVRALIELGLTPAARTKVKARPEKPNKKKSFEF